MIKHFLICALTLLTVNVFQTRAAYTQAWPQAEDDLLPLPGSLDASLSVSSMGDLLDYVVKLGAYLLKDHTFDIGFEKKGFLHVYTITVNSITTKSINVTDATISFVNNTDTLAVEISNITIDALVDGGVSALAVPVTFQEVVLKDVTLRLEASTTTENEVTWQLQQVNSITVEDLELTLKQKWLQHFVKTFHGQIMKGIDQACSVITEKVNSKVDVLNQKLANQTPDTFMSNILSPKAPLNYTSTRYFEFSQAEDLVKINIDGRFLDIEEDQIVVPQNEMNYTRQKDHGLSGQTNQFFMNEAFVNSLLYDISDSYMPFVFHNENLESQLFQLFSEFRAAYGPDVTLNLGLKLGEDHTYDAIKFNTTDGIMIGSSEQEDLVTILQFYCTNDTVTKELALEIEMNLQLYIDFSVKNFKINLQLNNPQITNAKVVSAAIPMHYHDYDTLLTDILISFAYDFNTTHYAGIDLKKKYKAISAAAFLIIGSVITPYQIDGYMYAGFSLLSDLGETLPSFEGLLAMYEADMAEEAAEAEAEL